MTRLSQRSEEIYKRLGEIEKEKIAQANKTLSAVYPTMQAYCFSALGAYLDIIDGTSGILDEYARETGARVSPFQHRNALRPYDVGKGKALYGRLKEWFKE